MAEQDQKYEHGNMDITTQEQTYQGFITFVTRAVVVILVILVFLALVGA